MSLTTEESWEPHISLENAKFKTFLFNEEFLYGKYFKVLN